MNFVIDPNRAHKSHIHMDDCFHMLDTSVKIVCNLEIIIEISGCIGLVGSDRVLIIDTNFSRIM
jgi:hypothetical protein